MFRLRTAALTLALAAVLPAASAADGGSRPGIDKVNGSIDAAAGQVLGDLSTVNGSIRIASGARTGDAETVNGSIKVADNVQCGDLTTVNGGIFVDRGGHVAKDITTVNGAIGLVDTDLDGGIDTVNGDVTVGVGSHVKGGIKVEKPGTSWIPIHFGKHTPPRIIIGPNAVVDGPLVFEREVKLYVHSTARIGKVTGATAIAYSGEHAPEN